MAALRIVRGGTIALAALCLSASTPLPKGIKVGEPAPDSVIELVDGSKVALSSLRGKVVVLNFWATWCAPCRAELPILDGYYNAQKAVGLRVFAVTTEDSVPLYQLRKLFALIRIPAARRIGKPYSAISAVPTNYVIGRDGRVRYAKADSFTLDDLNAILVPLLREPAPPGT